MVKDYITNFAPRVMGENRNHWSWGYLDGFQNGHEDVQSVKSFTKKVAGTVLLRIGEE